MASLKRGPIAHQAAIIDPRLEALLALHGPLPSMDDGSGIEAALYAPHLFALEEHEATALRFAAIRESFAYHAQHNLFYRCYCEAAGVSPEELHGPDDLSRIPLIPEHVFKGCPDPEAFVAWLASVSTDEIPWPVPGTLSGSYDEQIKTLRSSYGIQVPGLRQGGRIVPQGQ